MKLNLFLICFLCEYFVFGTSQENITSTMIGVITTVTELETPPNAASGDTSEHSSTVSYITGVTSNQPLTISSVSSELGLTTTDLPSSSGESHVNNSTTSRVEASVSSITPVVSFSGTTIVGSEVELNGRESISSTHDHSESTQNISPSVSSSDAPATEVVETVTSRSSSIESQTESGNSVTVVTTTNVPTTDTSLQSNLNENTSERPQSRTITINTENYATTSMPITPEVETTTTSSTTTTTTQTSETSQTTLGENISEISQTSTRTTSSASSTSTTSSTSSTSSTMISPQDTTTSVLLTSTTSSSTEESATDLQTNSPITESSMRHIQQNSTTSSSVETSKNSALSTERTDIQNSTYLNGSSSNTKSEIITSTTDTTSLSSQTLTVDPVSETTNSTTSERLDKLENNITRGNQSILNTTSIDGVFNEELKEHNISILNTTTDTSGYDSRVEGKETLNKYCKQSDIIFALLIMFSLHILSLTVVMLFIFHKMRKGRSWERPIMRYRASGVFNNNGSSPAQVECIGAVSGLNLASDSECKRGENEAETVPSINIKDGWCTPLEKNETKKKTEEDTGV